MSESENRDAVERFFDAADAQDWTTMKEFYSPARWRSGHNRVNGSSVSTTSWRSTRIILAHPSLQVRGILGAGDLVIEEAELDYSGTTYTW